MKDRQEEILKAIIASQKEEIDNLKKTMQNSDKPYSNTAFTNLVRIVDSWFYKGKG